MKEVAIKELLKNFNLKTIKGFSKLKFNVPEGFDVYNITAPFKIKRSNYILGRVEMRNDELGAKSIFFKKNKRTWRMDLRAPIFNLQDPFITKIGEMIILGGVEVMQKSIGGIKWRTVFYKGSTIYNLRKFTAGPWGMKDIRLVELEDKRIGVFTRPQGRKGRRGKIGFKIINSLKELTPRNISSATIFKDSFYRGEWGGVNEVHLLGDNKLGVLAHIANFQKHNDGRRLRHYYPMSFLFDLETNNISNVKIFISHQN